MNILVLNCGSSSVIESPLAAYVIPTDEELLIARDTIRCVRGARSAIKI